MTLEDYSLPEEDLQNNMPRGNLELNPVKPTKPKRDNDAADKATRNAALPTSNETWFSFVGNTSLHGIRYVFWKRPLWARIGWLLILLAFTAYFLFTAHMSLTRYFKRPINTVITQKYVNSLEFPAVSICPQNLVSKKKMYALDGDANFVKYGLNHSVCSATESVRNGKACGAAMVCCCLAFFLFDGGQIVPDCTVPYLLGLIGAQQSSGIFFDAINFYKKYGQGIQEMLSDEDLCIFGANIAKPCGISDFSTKVTDWGVCHTFNAGLGGPDNIKEVVFPGPVGGLNILLDAQMNDSTIARLSEGYSVIIHGQGEYFLPWDGINVSPGSQATITLHQQRVSLNPDVFFLDCMMVDAVNHFN